MGTSINKQTVYHKKEKRKLSVGCKELLSDIMRDRYLYLLLIPFVAYYALFYFRPMYALQIAFKDYSLYKGIAGSPWVGFENFIAFFTGPYFVRTLTNTLYISLYSIIFGFPAPIILALLFNEVRNKTFKKFSQTLTYMPYFISAVVVAGIVINFLSPTSGLVNVLIEKMGGDKTYFLSKPEYFRAIYTAMNIWKETGFGAVIYIAALAGIDQELYEAGVIDGANKWKQLWHITIPSILPTIAIMLILRIGGIMEVGYETIILLYNPAIYETSDVISTYVYRGGIQEGAYDMATAVGLFNATVALFLVFFANKISKKFAETSLW